MRPTARNIFTRSNTGIKGSNTTRGINVDLRFLFVLSPFQEVLPSVCKIHGFQVNSQDRPAGLIRQRKKKAKIGQLGVVSDLHF